VNTSLAEGVPVDTVEELVAQFRKVRSSGKKAALVQRLGLLLPDRRVFDFLLGILEGSRPEDGGARAEAIKQLWECGLTAAADRERVVAASLRIARSDSSSVARTFAISELAHCLNDEAVRAFFHQLLPDPTAPASDRQAAISSLPARFQSPELAALCERLLDDPLLATSARLRLKEWGAA
jgi:hypothetical protein